MIIVFQILLVLTLFGALAQIFGVAKPSDSKVTFGWLSSALLLVLLAEYFLYNFIDNETDQTIFLGLVTISLISNFIKFSFGYIQKKEITAYNRFEHFMAGVLLFYFSTLIDILQLLGVQSTSKLVGGVIIVAFVNLGSVVFEISELAVDKIKGKKYLVGPGAHDTNFDLLMLLLGSISGLIVWVLLK